MQKFRPLFNRMLQTKQPWTRAVQKPSSLLLPQKANFGGMMGMGELADVLAGKCDPNDAI
jgi:hypothetical protein